MSSEELKQAWDEELKRRRQALMDFEKKHAEVLAEHARLRERTMSNTPDDVAVCTYCGEWTEQPDRNVPAGWAWKASSCCNEDELCCPECAAKAPWNYCGNCVRM